LEGTAGMCLKCTDTKPDTKRGAFHVSDASFVSLAYQKCSILNNYRGVGEASHAGNRGSIPRGITITITRG